MAEPVSVIETADPAIVAATQEAATAHTQVATAHTQVATAHTQVATATTQAAAAHDKVATAQQALATNTAKSADASTRAATALEKMVTLESTPYPDHEVWLTFAKARAGLNDPAARSVPEVSRFADQMLLAYKQKFPRPIV